ncbi:MAG TPA: ERF family protein [Micromonosporaceae bacterium]
MTTTSLAEALAEFQADPPVLKKNKAGHQSKYADLVQVNEQVLARLNKLGVIYTCAPTLDEDGKFVLAYELRHVPTGETKGGRYPLKLSENPQQMGSAITYARRYVLLSLTGVAAEDEDDDGQAAYGRRTAQRAAQPRQQASAGQPTAQRQTRPAGGPPPLPGESGSITDAQQRLLYAELRKAGKGERGEALAYISGVLGRAVASTKDLTAAEASQVIDRLKAPAEAVAS